MMAFSNYSKRIMDKKRDNSGSVLITVLVAFLFVSVLVTMVLAAATVNFRMRTVDRNVKDEFYYAEKGLNDIYTGVGISSSKVMGDVYNKVLSNQGGTFGYNIENEAEAIKRFNKIFAESIKLEITKDKMRKYIVGNRAYLNLDSDPEIYYRYIDSLGNYQDTPNLEPDFDYLKFQAIVVKNVSVVSKNPQNEYVSVVTSDIVINSPMIDFVTVNKKELEFAVVANDGIFVDGDTTITGNVYGGELTSAELSQDNYGGINVDNAKLTMKSRHIISGGNINVRGKAGRIKISNTINVGNDASAKDIDTQCDVWFENMNIFSESSEALDAKANFYALDDLTVYGNGAGVKLVGNYYGYNDGTLGLKGKDYIIDQRNTANVISVDKKDDSSSLIVNSRNATVDMKGVDTFIMLGRAYINHASKQPETLPVALNMNSDENEISYKSIMTGEGVASKAEQELYLVPGEFLNISNPSKIDTIDPFRVTIPNQWFGKQYLNEENPGKTVVVKKGATSYGYCYLNFKDDESRLAYLMRIIPYADVKPYHATEMKSYDTSASATAISPTPEEIFNRLTVIEAEQGSKIFIGEDYILNNSERDEDGIHVYAPYGIVQNTVAKNEDEESYSVMLKTNDFGLNRFADYKNNMYNKYRWADTYLDTLEQRAFTTFDYEKTGINNYNRQLDSVDDGDVDNDGLPLSRLIWIGDGSYYDGARNLGGIGHLSTGVYKDSPIDSDDEDAVRKKLPGTVIVSKGDYKLTDSIDGFVIVDGNLTIENSVKVNGFVFATGQIVFKGNNEVKFNSTLLEQRIEKEIDRVKSALRNGESNPYKEYYLISYLLDVNPRSTGIGSITDNPIRRDSETGKVTWSYLKYNYGNEADMQTSAGINTDYRSYVVYENWKKGQIQ